MTCPFLFPFPECQIDEVANSRSLFRDCYAVNGNALELSCELLRNLITGFCVVAEAVQRTATIAEPESEGLSEIEETHLERVLPQLLLVARIGDSPFSFFFLSSFSLFFSLPFLFCPSVSGLIFFFLLPLI
ncbi:centromere protein X [Pyrus ussuriensis x Pyrus communis]|uniref:Centromere protein X n=1 Tax=Pyrus ussuriensis x Pyrus communis TaxID=2448454 RepID=A0A5N5ICX3_9ROSA|nr:centromere protein X [Pyrus ussuriensis x Pyrus communis]